LIQLANVESAYAEAANNKLTNAEAANAESMNVESANAISQQIENHPMPNFEFQKSPECHIIQDRILNVKNYLIVESSNAKI
jgi:hypothetical protein